MRAIEDILNIDILARQVVRQCERDFGFNPREPRDDTGKWTAEGIKNHLMARPGDKLPDIAKGLGVKKSRGLPWEDHSIGKTLAGMVASGHVEKRGEGYHMAARQPSGEAKPKPVLLPPDFKDRVSATARDAAAKGGHGVSNLKDKITIAHAHRAYQAEHGSMPLDQFKQGLLKHQGQGISLAKEDRPMSEGFSPEMREDLKNSTTTRGTSDYHWLRNEAQGAEPAPPTQSGGMTAPIVDAGRQMGLFARDRSGNPAEIGSSAGQADLFSRAKYAQEGPPKETPIQRQFDPRHTGGLFGPMESMPDKKKKPPRDDAGAGGMLFSADFSAGLQDFRKWLLEFEKEITRP